MPENTPQTIWPWLEILWEKKGSDLLLSGGSPPRIRVNGKLDPIEGAAIMTTPDIEEIVRPLITDRQREIFAEKQDVDFSFSWGEQARIRGSLFTQRGQQALALRIIPTKIPTFEELGLPPAADLIAKMTKGFILVTGPTGSGKSTTLASIVDRINATRSSHILTVEDPVEYVHNHKRSAISQREIGMDSPSFEQALRSALREDPDVLLIGEMRDVESIAIALTMAETGHVVFGTLHTNDAAQAVDRIIDVFPAGRQAQARTQLAASLSAIVAQRLIPRIGGGMVAAFEVLIATHPVRNLIREDRANQLTNVMFTSSKDGMQTMNMSLARLIYDNVIEAEDGFDISNDIRELERALAQMKSNGGR